MQRFCPRDLVVKCLLLSAFAAVLLTSACTTKDPDDENGTIGTGIILKGTISNVLLANDSTVEYKSLDGSRGEIIINPNGEFSTSSLAGDGPWLLQVAIDSDRILHGMAFNDGTRNINSFSDVSLRRWFAQASRNLEAEFSSSNNIAQLPTSSELDNAVASIVNQIELVLSSYNVTGDDIISTAYTTDGTGIDAFLKQNSVVIDDDLITFRITDPDTEIQTETGTAIEIGSTAVDNGTPPTVPSSVRALGGGNNDVVLIWEPSVDDVGVTGYVVRRNGNIIGTTPFPQYVDKNLDTTLSYRYTIVAIDAAGNASTLSNEVTGTPSLTGGTQAPQTPTQLSVLSASTRTIRLSWLQDNSPNVARYNVYRGLSGEPAALQQRVSATRATDTNVLAQETYCYQVAAVSAAGVESNRSEQLCVEATGAQTTSGFPLEPPEPIGEWTVPNIDALNCTAVLPSDFAQSGFNKLTQGCWSVPETLVIAKGATLQISEGVVLKFGEGAQVTNEGTLTVIGTQTNPVVFTGMESTPGYWGGIEFSGSNSTGNLLRGAVVQYGGGGTIYGAVAARFDNSRFRIENTLVRFNLGFALSLDPYGTQIDSFQGNRISNNVDVGKTIASAAHLFGGNNEYIDNDINELTIIAKEYVGEDIIMVDVGIPISTTGMFIKSGSLTIMPGTDIEILGGYVMEVEGSVNIMGTVDNPVTLRGATSAAGSWDGIKISGQGSKTISHTNISFAGEDNSNTGAVYFDCTGTNTSNIQINNTHITDSASWGIYIDGNGCTTNIDDTVTYSNNTLGNIRTP